MRRTLLFTLMPILFLAMMTAQAKEPTSTALTPDGRIEFKVSTEKILIAFEDGLSLIDQQQILSSEQGIQRLKSEDLLPSPNVTIAKVNLQNGEAVGDLLQRLNANQQIRYANPFLIYKDGTNQGIQDRVIVRLKSRKDYNQISSASKKFNLTVAEKNEFDPLMYVLQTTKQSTGNALDVANALQATGAFDYAEVDFLLLLKRQNTNDPNLGYQWSLDNTGSGIQYNGTAGADMKVFNAWGQTTGSSSIKVAVIDEGVDLTHPDLVGNMLGGYDATLQGSGGNPQGDDAHGTACAGIIAASGNNNLGGAGVAYNCKIIPVRIAYSSGSSWVTSNTWIGNALNWSWQTANADILSNSWGGGSSSSTINNAIDGAVNSGRGGLGAPVLFAAGNDNGANSYPATQTNVISVIAMSMCHERKNPSSCDGETWWGSNYGTGADVAAPGVKIYCTDISGSAGYSTGDYTGTFNGTSSATPNTAGVMALILSASSGLTEAQARAALESTCQKVGGYSYNNGVSGQPNGTWSNDLGYGLVNAYQAVLSVSPQFSDDAGVSAISSPNGSICATSATPSVTLTNYGSNSLTSVTINSQVDGGSTATQNWTGNLASGSSTTVSLASISFSGGAHTFDAWTSSPNGNSDNQAGNDQSSSSFTSASNSVTLSITFDNYPEETSWAVMDGATTLASGGTYASQADGSTLNIGLCLPDGCFDFVITDAYGDGICCAYGNGFYTLTDDSNGGTLASGGEFTNSETTNFCVTSSNPLVASISGSSDVSCFGGNNGSATASASGGVTPYSYSWSNGETGATATALTAGTHTVTVTDGNSDQAQENVTISQPTLLVALASGTDADCYGGPTGSATASASGGAAPYSYAWSSGGTSSTENGLSAGSYSVTITDNNGCADMALVTINNLPDSDNDGVCDANDQCPEQDDALIGTSCDDGDACTTGDVYDANCGCTGTLIDSDNDGVCDADDQCPGLDDALIGTSCDDGNACTTGDVYDANCGCSGTFADTDNDGVCDANDQCPGSDDALIGTACDDGNACTTGDVYDANCGCTGTMIDSDNDGVCDADDQCPGLDDALIGTACDDGNACTTGDVYDANCGCSGTFADSDNDGVCDANDQCPGSDDALIGTTCDDGNACTTGDVYDANCGCTGTLIDSDNDGVCDADDQCPGLDDALIGTACNDGNACTTGDVYDANCGCSGTFADTDNDGVCDANDQCPGSDDALIGTACDDGDECTENDVYDANCGCSGTVIEGCGGCTYTTINSNDFEGGWGIWSDGGGDVARVSNAAYANSGTYFIQLRNNSGVASSTTTSSLNLLAYSEVTIDFSFYARSMDNANEDFWLQISTDGGSSFTTIADYNQGAEFVNDQRYNETVVHAGVFSATTQFRFRCDASGNNDWIYIDDVVITGCEGAAPDPTCTDGIQNGDEAGIDCGGSECATCITCSDGIQNGDETGIDCGGSFCAPCNGGGCTYEVIDNGTFETGWGIWNDGGSDARRASSDIAFANNGTYCFRIQDNTSTSVATTDALNLVNYDELTIDFSFITSSMENNEDFWMQISTDGGSSYTTAQSWA
ncbi:MAG: subtilisin family serine protease, partial [Bacteroidia bacterium]